MEENPVSLDWRTLSINEPSSAIPGTVSSMAPGEEGYLCYASGDIATTSMLAGIVLKCEPIEEQGAEGELCCETLMNDPDATHVWPDAYKNWTAESISGAKSGDATDQWNILHACVFYHDENYEIDPEDAVHETAEFKGVHGECDGSGGGPIGPSLNPVLALLESLAVGNEASRRAVGNNVQRLLDLINHRWDKEIGFPRTLTEPSDRDGDWLLYKNLPVNRPDGAKLGLDGKPLTASSISVAVDRIELKRTRRAPVIHSASPGGPGFSGASNSWLFPYFPAFGVVVHQSGTPQNRRVQAISSGSRVTPTHMFVENRPIYITVNSPKLQTFLNEGCMDVWVRVNPSAPCS